MYIKNINDFIEELPPLVEKSRRGVFYRGQSNINYNLEPSVFRDKAKGKEDKI